MLPVIKYDPLISIHITYIQFYYALYFTLERRRDEKKKKYLIRIISLVE